MSEMVERVALAIYVAEIGGPEGWNHPRVEAGKERWFAKARAAIEAMREPTETMVNEGADELRAGDRSRSTPPHVWRAMIDGALHSEKVTT
jgi:hypothetical protein